MGLPLEVQEGSPANPLRARKTSGKRAYLLAGKSPGIFFATGLLWDTESHLSKHQSRPGTAQVPENLDTVQTRPLPSLHHLTANDGTNTDTFQIKHQEGHKCRSAGKIIDSKIITSPAGNEACYTLEQEYAQFSSADIFIKMPSFEINPMSSYQVPSQRTRSWRGSGEDDLKTSGSLTPVPGGLRAVMMVSFSSQQVESNSKCVKLPQCRQYRCAGCGDWNSSNIPHRFYMTIDLFNAGAKN